MPKSLYAIAFKCVEASKGFASAADSSYLSFFKLFWCSVS